VQQSQPAFSSPCFRPELLTAVAASNPKVHVAVVEDSRYGVAFLPFERDRFPVARPVFLTDYQALITPDPAAWDATAVLRACRLYAWDFSAMPAPRPRMKDARLIAAHRSPVMDLSRGYEAYRADLRARGNSLRNLENKARWLARDHGALRFVPRCRDRELLHRLLAWKAQRFTANDSYPASVVRPLETILACDREVFEGVLSALFAGDRPVAAHLGMRSGTTFHYWFGAYDPELSRYAPGLILLDFLARHAGEFGTRTIDLGPGGEKYKEYFENASIELWSGSVARPYVAAGRSALQLLGNAVRSSPALHRALRPVVRGWRKMV
jgi:CelD/BcsL family acetyltransferase involved in cellulose biosynthesis